MERTEKQWKDILDGHRMMPPEVVWEKLEEQLLARQNRKRVLVLWRIAAAMAAVVSLSIGLWMLRPQQLMLSQYTNGQPETTVHQTVSPSEGTPAMAAIRQPATSAQTSDRTAAKPIKRTGYAVEQNIPTEVKMQPPANGSDYTATAVQPADTGALSSLPNRKDLPVSASVEIAQRYLDSLKNSEAAALSDPAEASCGTPKWAMNGAAAPTYTYRTLGKDMDRQQYANESGTVAYSAGLSMEYKAGSRWSVRSGVYLARYGNVSDAQVSGNVYSGIYADYNTSKSISVESSLGDISSADGEVHGSLTERDQASVLNPGVFASGQVTQLLDFVEIPVHIRYRLVGQKLGLNLLGGLGANILVGKQAQVEFQSAENPELDNIQFVTSDIRTYNFNGSLGLGLQYKVGRRITFDLEPILKVFLNSVNRSESKSVYPYSIGIYTGFTYNL